MFHRFSQDVSGEKVPERFNNPFWYEPHRLCVLAAEELQEYLIAQTQWQEEISQGKMFGVLVVQNTGKEIGYLCAFSGNLAQSNIHEHFVPPVYDMLSQKGFFRVEEQNISQINHKIESLQNSDEYLALKTLLQNTVLENERELRDAKIQMKNNKTERERLRTLGLTPEQSQELIKQSQREKSIYKSLQKSLQEKILVLQSQLSEFDEEIASLKEERKTRSAVLQNQIFDKFQMLNARGEIRGLREIFASTPQIVPPAGAGECAAPKLLQYAYANNLQPLSMAEFWWGKSPIGEIRHHLNFYPACKSKCYPILGFMLQGLDVEENIQALTAKRAVKIVYEDKYLVVVNKPEGMLSVRGKIDVPCVVDEVQKLLPNERNLMIVHRLDMATSGLLVIAKGLDTYRLLQKQFANQKVKKTYLALLEGVVKSSEGEISLPISADYEHRPCQKIDFENGKPALTLYKVLSIKDKRTLIEFSPITGRTHQLRIHSAYPEGLNCPIVGDELYGTKSHRLCLHALRIEFKHPYTGQLLSLTSEIDF